MYVNIPLGTLYRNCIFCGNLIDDGAMSQHGIVCFDCLESFENALEYEKALEQYALEHTKE